MKAVAFSILACCSITYTYATIYIEQVKNIVKLFKLSPAEIMDESGEYKFEAMQDAVISRIAVQELKL